MRRNRTVKHLRIHIRPAQIALVLLFIVGLLAYGEACRHGQYHLDGGRGWDLPQTSVLDAGHSSGKVDFVQYQAPADTPLALRLEFLAALLHFNFHESLAVLAGHRMRPPPLKC